MDVRSDAELVRRSVQGDESAFAGLVRRYLGTVTRLIRYQVGDCETEDLLQETLIQAWKDLPRLRDPDRVRPWLLQVARNRCRDFFKGAQRRELPTAGAELELHVNRLGRALFQQGEAVVQVREGLEHISPADRELIRSFYLEGWTIAEIAARGRLPEGTIKRRLFHARHHLREALAGKQERREKMSVRKKGSKAQPFPRRRPEIRIKPSRAQPFAVDCRELRWWFGRPVVGERTIWAIYDPPEWKISYVTDMRGAQEARIHDLDGVETDVDEWSAEDGWEPGKWTMWGRLTDDAVQWLATSRLVEGKRQFRTFLDEGFEDDWGGEEPRKLEDRGCFIEEEDGVFRQKKAKSGAIGAGIFSVRIGEKRFTCLRVIDVDEEPNEEQTLVEAYLTKTGRTVLFRRYNGRLWGHKRGREPWDETLPDHRSLVVDGVMFVHWYDCLTGLALGI